MASENLTSGLISQIADKLVDLPGVSLLVKIGQALGIVIFVYIFILIVRAFVQMRQGLRIKSIAKNVEEINQKLDALVGRKSAAKKEVKKEEKKK